MVHALQTVKIVQLLQQLPVQLAALDMVLYQELVRVLVHNAQVQMLLLVLTLQLLKQLLHAQMVITSWLEQALRVPLLVLVAVCNVFLLQQILLLLLLIFVFNASVLNIFQQLLQMGLVVI